jgi:membrane protein required for colicin V production
MALTDALSAVAPLDWVLLAVLGLSMVIGLWRGLVFELMSLAGWVVAWGVAQRYADAIAPWLPLGQPGTLGRGVAAYGATFILTLLLCAVLARLVRALVAASPLSGLDRLLGAGFGLARGLVLLLVAATVVMWTPAARSPLWQASQGAAWLGGLTQWLRPLWPGADPAAAQPRAAAPAGLTIVCVLPFKNGLHPCAASSA